MHRDRHRSTIVVMPALVTTGLPLTSNPRRVAARRKSSARALGMNDFGRVGRECRARFAELSLDHCEDLLQLHKGLCSGRHQGVAARNGRHFGDPTGRLIAIKQHFVIVETHASF